MVKKIVIFLLLGLVVENAHAFLSKGYNIEELSRRSDSIFMGEVMNVEESSTDSKDIPNIEVTFKIFETLKGKVPAVYTYKQFAPKVRNKSTVMGMSKSSYIVGDKSVVFLGGPSKEGFAAPIDFQLYRLLTKSNKQQDLDRAIIINQQFGEKMNQNLFQHLKKKGTLELFQQLMAKKQKVGDAHMNYGEFRQLIIKASVEP